MTDIRERLRRLGDDLEWGEGFSEARVLLHDAADEIERLTSVLQYIASLDDDGAAPVLARRAVENKP